MRRGARAALLVAAGALAAAPARAQDPAPDPAAMQARRADELMDRLYADHGNEALLREAEGLLAECLASGNHRTAEYVAGQIVYHRPASLADRHRYVRILLAKGERAAAEKDLRALIRERPTDCAAHGMLADLLRVTGRYREAMEVHAAHLREHSGDAAALDARATIAIWDLRDAAAVREGTARMREAAAAPGTPAATAEWLRSRAAYLDEQAARMDKEGATLRAAESRVDGLLAGAVVAAVIALAGALHLTGRRR
jgi:hypothetical protein